MGAREVAGGVIVLPFVKFQYVTNLTVREAPPLLLQPCAAALRPARLGVAALGEYLPWAPGEPCVAGWRGLPGHARIQRPLVATGRTSDSDHTRARALRRCRRLVSAPDPALAHARLAPAKG